MVWDLDVYGDAPVPRRLFLLCGSVLGCQCTAKDTCLWWGLGGLGPSRGILSEFLGPPPGRNFDVIEPKTIGYLIYSRVL